MPFLPRGPGLAQLAQAAQQFAAGGAVPPQPKRMPEPAGNIPKRTQETINPVDLPGGVGQVGPPQPIYPQMPPWMQLPIQDPLSPAPPPIGQPAPIPPPQEDGQALLQVLSQMAGPIRQDMQNFQNQQNEADAIFGRNRPDPAEQQRLDRQRLGQQALDNQIRAIQQQQFQQR